jgi:hypothetical protein
MKTTIRNWTWLIGGLCMVVFFAPLVFAPDATDRGRVLLLVGVCTGAFVAYFDGLKPILTRRRAVRVAENS